MSKTSWTVGHRLEFHVSQWARVLAQTESAHATFLIFVVMCNTHALAKPDKSPRQPEQNTNQLTTTLTGARKRTLCACRTEGSLGKTAITRLPPEAGQVV